MNGSVISDKQRKRVRGKTWLAIESKSHRGMSYLRTAPIRPSLKPHILHFKLHRLFWSMKTLRTRSLVVAGRQVSLRRSSL